MVRILIFYYSRTGNTEKMAKAIAEGIQNFGKAEVEMNYYVDVDDLSGFDAILVGTPTFNHDMPLETKKLFEQAAARGIDLKGKLGGTFGSYGWSGEAPKLVLEIMIDKFGMRVFEQPLTAKYTPDSGVLELCRDYGRRISETLIHQN
jgi:NAD(P)H dehydrogenase (quinone)